MKTTRTTKHITQLPACAKQVHGFELRSAKTEYRLHASQRTEEPFATPNHQSSYRSKLALFSVVDFRAAITAIGGSALSSAWCSNIGFATRCLPNDYAGYTNPCVRLQAYEIHAGRIVARADLYLLHLCN